MTSGARATIAGGDGSRSRTGGEPSPTGTSRPSSTPREELIAARAPVTIAGVASAAGVSRVTVYAHFPTTEALLEAVVERAVGHAAERAGGGPPGRGAAR